MQMIQFESRNDVIEMIESRFEYAHVTMSHFMRDSIEHQIHNNLQFEFDYLYENIEIALHFQCAINYVNSIYDENEVNFAITMCARDSFANRTFFECINVDDMKTIMKFAIDRDLKITIV